jgi:type IV pilus assembly protein PilE
MTHSNSNVDGFSLLELVMTLAVFAILAGVAYPSYADYVKKMRRAEATDNLLFVRQAQEHFYLEKRTYTDTLSTINAHVGPEGAYTFDIQPGATGDFATSFIVFATPVAGKGDENCGVLTIDQNGIRTNSKGGSECWR